MPAARRKAEKRKKITPEMQEMVVPWMRLLCGSASQHLLQDTAKLFEDERLDDDSAGAGVEQFLRFVPAGVAAHEAAQ
jgi:hypothetical protein